MHFIVLRFSFVPILFLFMYLGTLNEICHPKENYMKKGLFLCLLFLSSTSSFSRRHPLPYCFNFDKLTIPVSYTFANKPTVLYIPSACSGMINDAVAGEGKMAVSVLGKIQNDQLSVQVKVDYNGMAVTSVEGITYQVNGYVAASETKTMASEPIDIFVKGHFKLEARNKASNLFITDIGYITIYPDGSVTNHILDPKNDPDYSRPKVYCTEPKG